MLLAERGEYEVLIDADASKAEKNIDLAIKKLDKMEERLKKFNDIGIRTHVVGLESSEKEVSAFTKSVKRSYEDIAKTIQKTILAMDNVNAKVNKTDYEDKARSIRAYAEELSHLLDTYARSKMNIGNIEDHDVDKDMRRARDNALEKLGTQAQTTELPIAGDDEDYTAVWRPILDGIKEVEQAEQELTPVEPEQIIPEDTVETVEERARYTAETVLMELQRLFNKGNIVGNDGTFSEDNFHAITDAIKKDIEGLIGAVSALPHKGSGALAGALTSFDKVLSAYDNATQRAENLKKETQNATEEYEKQAKKVDTLKYQLGRLQEKREKNQKIADEAYGRDVSKVIGGKETEKAFEKTKKELEKGERELLSREATMNKKKAEEDNSENVVTEKFNAEVAAYAKLVEAIEKYIEALQKKNAEEKKNVTPSGGGPNNPDDVKSKEEQIKEFNNKAKTTAKTIATIKNAINAAIGVISKMAHSFANATRMLFQFEVAIGRGVVGAIQKCVGGIRGLINSLKQTFNTMKGKLKRLLRYTLGLRGMFTLFRKLRTAIKQAIQNLVQFDKAFGDGVTSVNNSISMVKNAFLQLKNQIIAAFAPLINIVIPQYVVPMINAIIAAMQKLSMFIAYLTGAPKWIRATKINDDYAKSLDNVGGSAKKAANNLSSLDEIHLWQDDNGGGGGGDSNKTKPEDMFEWVDTPAEMITDPATLAKMLADRINLALALVDWNGVGESIAKYMNIALAFVDALLDSVHWYKLGEGLSSTVNAILKSGDWDKLGEFIALKRNALIETLNGFFDNLSWEKLSSAITEALTSAIKKINISGIAHLVANVFTNALDVAATVISDTEWDTFALKIISGLETITEEAEKFDWAELGKKIANGIRKIPWSQILSSVMNAGESVFSGILESIISLIENADVKELTSAVQTGIARFFRGVTRLLREIDWKEVELALRDFFSSLDFNELLEAFADFQVQVLKALGATARGLIVAIPKLILSVKEIGVEFGFNGGDIVAILMGALGAGAAAAGLKFATASSLLGKSAMGGLITMGVGLVVAITAFAIEIQDALGASTAAQIVTAIAGAVGVAGVALAPVTGGWSLVLTGVATLLIGAITIGAASVAKQEALSGITALRESLQTMVQEVLDSKELVVQVNAKANVALTEVDTDFATASELLHELLNMDFSNGATVESIQAVYEKLDLIKQLIGEDNYNALGIYFDTASGSIQTTREDVTNLTEDLDVLIQKMLEQAEKEALIEVWKEYRKELYENDRQVRKYDQQIGELEEHQKTLNKSYYDAADLLDRYNYGLGDMSQAEFEAEAKALMETMQDEGIVIKDNVDVLSQLVYAQDDAWKAANVYEDKIEDLNNAVEPYRKACDELKGTLGDVANELYGTNDASSTLSGSIMTLNQYFGEAVTAVDEYGNRLDLWVDANGKVVDSNGDVYESAYKIIDANGEVVASNGLLMTSNGKIVSSNGNVIKSFKEIVDENGKVVDSTKVYMNANGELIDSNGQVLSSNAKVLTADGKYISILELMASATGDKATQMTEAIKRWGEQNGMNTDNLVAKFGSVPVKFQEQMDSLEQSAAASGLTMEQMMGDNGVNIIKGLVDGMLEEAGATEAERESIWDEIGTSLCEMYGIHSPSTVFEGFGASLMQGLLLGMEEEFNPITEFFNSTAEAAKSAFAEIPANIASGLSGMGSRIKAPLNDAITVMNSFISKMISVANKFASTFNSIRTGINSLPNTTKLPYLMQVSGFSVSALAAGAVIPPNAPFLAMLGDQSHGRNLEAPESLIREIMREELGTASKGGSYQFVAQLNRRTLFEEMIDEAEMRQLRTGENPFML